MKRANWGVFVSIEGCDGAGKSTLCNDLCDRLRRAGYGCAIIDKRPTFENDFLSHHVTKLGELTWAGVRLDDRRIINDLHWLYMAAAWYAVIDQHCVQPALAQNDFVLADSWYDKLLARFALKPAPVKHQASTVFRSFSRPDLTFFLDVDPAEAARRKTTFAYSETGNLDGYVGATAENFIAYQSRVRQAYQALMTGERWVMIDANDCNREAVVATILNEIQQRV